MVVESESKEVAPTKSLAEKDDDDDDDDDEDDDKDVVNQRVLVHSVRVVVIVKKPIPIMKSSINNFGVIMNLGTSTKR